MHNSDYTLDKMLLQLKRDFLAAMVEFLGTMLFLLMGLGGIQAAAISNQAARAASASAPADVASIEQLLYVSTSMGLALLAAAWTFFRVSGSVFNPNVAIALLLTGALKPMRFCLYVIAELTGAIAASAILKGVLPGPLAVGTSLGSETKPWQGVLIEAFLTCALTLTVLLVAVEKHRATPFAPVAIGLVLFAAHLLGVVFTGAAMNTARAFGPSVITGFKGDHWVYWIGPSFGAILATIIYIFLKSVDYYALAPKQDSDAVEDSPDLKGIEVKMRRRHDIESSPNTPDFRQDHSSHKVNPVGSDRLEFELAQMDATSIYQPSHYLPGPTSPTFAEAPRQFLGIPSPEKFDSADPTSVGMAMGGGVGLGLAGETAKLSVPGKARQSEDLSSKPQPRQW